MARASLEELRLDYEDFLRQRGLPNWDRDDPRRQDLIDRRCTTADEVAAWVREVHDRGRVEKWIEWTKAIVYSVHQVHAVNLPGARRQRRTGTAGGFCSLLDRQLAAQATAFETEGGFTERLFRLRSQKRSSRPPHGQSPPRPPSRQEGIMTNKKILPGFEDMMSFGLIEALLGRRSRRFFMGAEIPDGVFAYTSRHEPSR